MGQHAARLFISISLLLTACDRSSIGTSPATTRAITVASLSPAATEILLGMGAGEKLVAVSNFDPPRPATKNLPRVGDYQTTDWERLAALKPAVMVTQFARDRLPNGLVQKSRDLGIELVNVPITRLVDIYTAMTALGGAIGEPSAGAKAVAELKNKLDGVAKNSAGRRVRALIVIDDAGRGVAGRDNYLNDILEVAGGLNVIRPGTSPYPAIDPEMLSEVDPEVIFQLLPEASPLVLTRARQLWKSMPNLQAVRNARVHILSDPLFMQPSQHVAELAQQFAGALAEARSATAGAQP
jgi:ABC-type Fe3+-hydroxamate transport system substrate-binding protein